jgi:hypothetical protein
MDAFRAFLAGCDTAESIQLCTDVTVHCIAAAPTIATVAKTRFGRLFSDEELAMMTLKTYTMSCLARSKYCLQEIPGNKRDLFDGDGGVKIRPNCDVCRKCISLVIS